MSTSHSQFDSISTSESMSGTDSTSLSTSLSHSASTSNSTSMTTSESQSNNDSQMHSNSLHHDAKDELPDTEIVTLIQQDLYHRCKNVSRIRIIW